MFACEGSKYFTLISRFIVQRSWNLYRLTLLLIYHFGPFIQKVDCCILLHIHVYAHFLTQMCTRFCTYLGIHICTYFYIHFWIFARTLLHLFVHTFSTIIDRLLLLSRIFLEMEMDLMVCPTILITKDSY